MNTKKVLLPLDGSPFSLHILPYICQLIKPDETELIVLRVAPWPKGSSEQPVRISPITWLLPLDPDLCDVLPNAVHSNHPIYASQEAKRQHARILEDLRNETQPLSAAGYRITHMVEFGDPAKEIINVVEHQAIDMVAMATHGRSGMSHLVLGSVAEQVLHQISIPVLLIRPTPHAGYIGSQAHAENEHSQVS